SETIHRDPRDCVRQREAFKSFLTSPEFMSFVRKHGMRTDLLAAMASEEEMQKLRKHLATQPHVTRLRRSIQQRTGTGPLPSFLEAMDADYRRNLRLVLYNDADRAQRDWLLDWHREHADDGLLTITLALGWTSFRSLEQFAQNHPHLTISPMASDDYAAGYGVTSLPAIITFPDDALIQRVQGLLPPEGDDDAQIE
ncbi:MAG: hypothetical protein ACOCXA_08330, partial [Planctomycetota bacterium]